MYKNRKVNVQNEMELLNVFRLFCLLPLRKRILRMYSVKMKSYWA